MQNYHLALNLIMSMIGRHLLAAPSLGGGTSPCGDLAVAAWIIQIPAGMAAARAREMEVFEQIWVKTYYRLLPRPAMATLSASFPS